MSGEASRDTSFVFPHKDAQIHEEDGSWGCFTRDFVTLASVRPCSLEMPR
jgi:hypothetical protein